jgi:TonB family protein
MPMSSQSIEEESMHTRRLLPWTIALSFLLHGVAYASLGSAPVTPKPTQRKTQLRFDVVEKARPKQPEPAKPEPEPVKPKPQKVAEPKPVAAPPTPVETPPAASDGVTLAGDGSGPGFAMPLGNGGSLEPTRVRSLAPVNAPVPATPAPSPAKVEPVLVAVGDLSSKPSPPALGPALERNYPPDARRRGLSGTAKVRARIDPDGVVRRVSLLEESGSGFGTACSKALSGSRWAAPKDKAGRAVATEIRYTCRFVVE